MKIKKKLKLGIKSRMELFRVMIGKVIPLTNFEPFLNVCYFWPFGKEIPLTNFEPFSGLILLLTIWQGDTFDQFWTFFWTYITFDYLARWYLWPILNLFLEFHYFWLLGRSFKGYLTSVKAIFWLHFNYNWQSPSNLSFQPYAVHA